MNKNELEDRVYTSEEVHSPYAPPVVQALRPHLPVADKRYKGVEILNGEVVDLLYESAPAPAKEVVNTSLRAPALPQSRAFNKPNGDPELDGEVQPKRNPTIDMSAPENPKAAPLADTALSYQELVALAKERGLNSKGTKAELLARLQGA